MKVLALTKYGPLAASTRQRILLYGPALAAAGIELEVSPLLYDTYVRRLAEGLRQSKLDIAAAYVRRLQAVAGARRYDAIWVYAEAFPYLPGPFEQLVGWSGGPVVVDWDDAFFHMYDSHPRRAVRAALGRKMSALLRSASAVTCGNDYLREYAERYCERTLVVPTVVDTERYVPLARRHQPDGRTLIGWMGSPSTWRNVRPLLPLLEQLVRESGARFRAIGAGPAARQDCFEGMELAEWSEATEIAEVQAMDIGIMPLEDLPFEQGKCGYKLIQYMACGVPVVASPVGVNTAIVRAGANGLLAGDLAEWRDSLLRLLADPDLRVRWGAAGRQDAVARYSLSSQAPRVTQLFQSLDSPRVG